MNSNNRKSRLQNPGTTRQQFNQRQRIFSSGKSDKNPIALFYKPIFHHSFTEPLFNTPQSLFFLCKLCHKNHLKIGCKSS